MIDQREDSTRPKRIQRKRSKGWRMPDGAVYVGRPTRWGNPFRVGGHYKRCGDTMFGGLAVALVFVEASDGHQDATYTKLQTRAEVVAWFRWYRTIGAPLQRDQILALRGRDLACWCPLDQPCHADVLLEIANGTA